MTSLTRRSTTGRLRIIAFGSSIVSDFENPMATSARAVLRELVDLGHDVTFFEERNNPAVVGMLKARGSAPIRAFYSTFPTIPVRTYELPRGWQRTVWFGAEAGTVDAIIALPGTPATLLPEIAALATRRVTVFLDESFEAQPNAYSLVRATSPAITDGQVAMGPAIQLGEDAYQERIDNLVVVYDTFSGNEARQLDLPASGAKIVMAGSHHVDGAEFVAEVDLPGLYRHHRRALVIGAGDSPWALARLNLPLAYGCESIGQTTNLEPRFSARFQAESLILAASQIP